MASSPSHLFHALVALAVAAFIALAPGLATADEATDPIFPDAEVEEPIAEVTVQRLETGLAEAGELLEEQFGHFLVREPLGFDLTLGEVLVEDVRNAGTNVENAFRDPQSVDIWAILGFIGAIFVTALFLLFWFFMDRQFTRMAHRIQARIHLDGSSPITAALRRVAIVAGQVAAVPILILLSFFPVRATFGAQAWALVLTDLLVLFLIYKLVAAVLAVSFRLHKDTEERRLHGSRLELFGVTVLRVAVGFSAVLAAMTHFGAHEDLIAFVTFLFRLSLAVVPVALFVLRDAVLSLLPSEGASTFYRNLRRGLQLNFHWVVAMTIILLLFNAAGYVNAATFLLTRGYALVVVGVVWFAGVARLKQYIQRRQEDAEESGELPSPMLPALQQWSVALGTLLLVIVSLRLAGIYEPIIALLGIPFLAVGRVEISLLNLLNVALIVVGTVLSIRLLKAVLNARVYPALQVEVGAAYAINTLINYALVVAGFVLCLVALGVHLSAVMVVFASLGVGIGFGLQNIAENLISGFILLFGRAVKKGDFITVNNLYGRVEAVGARSVVVRTPDNFSMLIPSKEIVSGRIINWTFQDNIVRIHIPVGVSYDSDPAQVKEVLVEAASRHPDILQDPAPDVWISDFGDNAIRFELLVYFDCQTTNEATLKGKFNFLLWEALKEAGVGIPYPQRDLHIRSVADGIGLPENWPGPPRDRRLRSERQDGERT